MLLIMHNWFFLAVAVYVLHAVNIVIDKFLLGKRIANPSVYAFLSGALSIFALVLVPFSDFIVPSVTAAGYALVSGAAFVLALYFYSYAIRHDDASRVAPLIGGVTPFFAAWFSFLFWGEKLSGNDLKGFLLLAGGMAVLAFSGFLKDSYTAKEFGATVGSSLCLAASYVFAKAIFLNGSFIDGIVWIRMSAFLASLFLLLSPAVRNFFRNGRAPALWGTTGAVFVGNKLLGSASLLLLNYAIALSPHVGIVSALQGIEFVLVFLAAIAFSRWRPAILEEKLTASVLLLKTAAIFLVGAGVFFIARPFISW